MIDNSSYQSLKDLHKVCLSQHIPFASYRMPFQSEITSLVQYTSFPKKIDTHQDLNKKSGFIVSPFFENEKNSTFLLEPNYILNNKSIEKAFIQTLTNTSLFLNKKTIFENDISDTKKVDFVQQVENAKNIISDGKCSKIVLSKVQLDTLKNNFDASAFFLELCDLYPHAFISFIQLPEIGCWIGASPEPLIEISGESAYTVSLAGTQKAASLQKKDIAWSKKEISEQKIVSDYIEATLENNNIFNFNVKGPYTYKAGNLVHLKTEFSFKRESIINRLRDFIDAIHPTPSVCGLPKDASMDFILNNEQHNRSYYAGYLGPINIADETHLFVNLRCLQLFNQQVVIYSGAGITAASNAEKEWEETNQKMMTLLNVINKD